MTPEQHDRVGRLFLQAQNLAPHEREHWIESRCADDRAVHDRLVAMLAEPDEGEPNLETPALAQPGSRDALGEMIGANASPDINGLSITRRIGVGGMGVVYEAQQSATGRRVAVKIIRAELATPETIRRFELEKTLLAQMRHPNIAQIFDAGSTQVHGQTLPYFVMELIEGRPLLEHAGTLDIRQRLELLATIADGVQHAHQRGVIHRDLKPANILIDGEGIAKILDFGVARVVDVAFDTPTIETGAGRLIGTLAYMSPEQVTSDRSDFDTRADVYSLGVLGYEMLSGKRPLDVESGSFAQAIAKIEREEPTPLADVSRPLRGDVSTIIAKAMAKERSRRYGSASEFASDLRRFLNDEPVSARPAGALYLFGKFARRNTGLVAGIALAMIALVAGLTIAIVQVGVANRASADAQRQLRIQQALSEFFIDDLLMQASPQHQADREITLREVLDEAAQRIDAGLADEPELKGRIRLALGSAYHALDDGEKAEHHTSRAVELLTEALGPDDPRTLHARTELAYAHGLLSRHQQVLDDTERIIEDQRRALGATHEHTIRTMILRARSSVWLSKFDQGRKLLEQVLADAPGALGDDHPNVWEARWLLAYVYVLTSRHADALPLAQAVMDLRAQSLGEDHPNSLDTAELLANIYGAVGQYDKAYAERIRIYESRSRIQGEDHHLTNNALAALGTAQFDVGKPTEGEASLRSAIETRARISGDEHPATNAHRGRLAQHLLDADRNEEAAALLRPAAESLASSLGPDHLLTLNTQRRLGAALARTGNAEEGVVILQDVVDRFRAQENPGALPLATSLIELGRAQAALDDFEDAERALLDGHEMLVASQASPPDDIRDACASLAALYDRWERPADRDAWLARSEASR